MNNWFICWFSRIRGMAVGSQTAASVTLRLPIPAEPTHDTNCGHTFQFFVTKADLYPFNCGIKPSAQRCLSRFLLQILIFKC
jgi:hypothetical protein